MYPAISPMSLALLMLLTPTYSVPFRHNTSAEGSHAHATKWLPANIHHASLLEVAKAVRRPEVYLPGLASTQSDTRLQGPVYFQAIRLDYCCNRCDYAHRAFNVEQQRLRPCLRLFKGVRCGQSCFVDEQIGAARNTGQCLQLDTWFFFETTLTALSLPEPYLHSLTSMPVLFRDRR